MFNKWTLAVHARTHQHVNGGRSYRRCALKILGTNAVCVGCLHVCCIVVPMLGVQHSPFKAPLAWLIQDYTDRQLVPFQCLVNGPLSNAAGAHCVEPVEQFLLHPSAHLMVHGACHITDMRFNMTCCPAAVWLWLRCFHGNGIRCVAARSHSSHMQILKKM